MRGRRTVDRRYIGIFDNVAKALDFDEGSMKKVITNIEEVKKQIPALLRKCLSYFMGVDRTVDGWEGLMPHRSVCLQMLRRISLQQITRC